MRIVLILLVLIVVIGAGVGYSRGWFELSSRNDGGKPNITLSVDREKIDADKEKVVEKMQGMSNPTADENPTAPVDQD